MHRPCTFALQLSQDPREGGVKKTSEAEGTADALLRNPSYDRKGVGVGWGRTHGMFARTSQCSSWGWMGLCVPADTVVKIEAYKTETKQMDLFPLPFVI